MFIDQQGEINQEWAAVPVITGRRQKIFFSRANCARDVICPAHKAACADLTPVEWKDQHQEALCGQMNYNNPR
jgi:hypothetical protein